MLETLLKERNAAGLADAGAMGIESASVPVEEEEESTALAVTVLPAEVGLWALLATITMLFAGFSSAYLVRRAAPDWVPIYCPPVLWVNTVLLVLSSVALEVAKTRRRMNRARAVPFWLLAGVGLGLAFLGGQLFAWNQLSAQGIFVPTSPHSSFFYVLTGVHAAHVLGGIGGLFYALFRRGSPATRPGSADPVALCATYWHFVTGIWIYLFGLLFIWQ